MKQKLLPPTFITFYHTMVGCRYGALLFTTYYQRARQNKKIGTALLALLSCLLIPPTAYAHRGAIDEIDDCRIKVGYEWIHFTAYTPTLTGAKEYCKTIPQLGPTNLVFDYEGKKLRDDTVEFEVTKEPEGTRIFYQEPQKIKTGTVNGEVDFTQYGAGDYLAHVTIVHEGEKIDSHVPFTVGIAPETDISSFYFVIATLVFIVIIFIMIWMAKRKEKSNIPSGQA